MLYNNRFFLHQAQVRVPTNLYQFRCFGKINAILLKFISGRGIRTEGWDSDL